MKKQGLPPQTQCLYDDRNDKIRLDRIDKADDKLAVSLMAFFRELGVSHVYHERVGPMLAAGTSQLFAAFHDRPWPPWGLGAQKIAALCQVDAIGAKSYGLSPVYTSERDSANIGLVMAVYKEVLDHLAAERETEVNYLVIEGSVLADRVLRSVGFSPSEDLVLTEEAVEGYRTEAKMNPPLRTPEDVAAVRAGLADGTLDIIATDHAPHHYDEKEAAFADAPNGIVGLETALGVILTRVVGEGVIDLSTMVERMSCQPARAFALPGGTLAPGSPGDVTVFDPEAVWTVDPARFHSKSRNTPFAGWKLKGVVRHTLVGGKAVFQG